MKGATVVLAQSAASGPFRALLTDSGMVVRDAGPASATAGEPPGQSAESSFLQWIVDHYEKLPSRMVFLHSAAWHRSEQILDVIRALPKPADYLVLGEHLLIEDAEGHPNGPHSQFRALHQKLFGRPRPEFVTCRGGSLFAVSKSCVRRRPRKFYEQALLMARSEEGSRFIERSWDAMFGRDVALGHGVVTAADSKIFRDLQFMIESLRAVDDCPVVVYDLGLEHFELLWCLSQPNVICRSLPPMSVPLANYVGSHRWQAWLKPTYILDAPFSDMLWIDADCVVLKPLDAAFEHVARGPLVLPEVATGGGQNYPELYHHLTIPDLARSREPEINNGVIGLRRDRDRLLLDAWLYAIQWAVMHPELRHLIRWYDQGSLLWALLRTGNEHWISHDQTWNYPAISDNKMLRRAIVAGTGLVESIRHLHRDAGIVHWYGMRKLSVALDEEIRALMAQRTERESDYGRSA